MRCHLIAVLLVSTTAWAVATPAVGFAQAPGTGSKLPGSAWNKSDHAIAQAWLETLIAFADRLDDCTYKGRFSNLDNVPDACNGPFTGAGRVIGGDEEGLLTFFRRSCAKWRRVALSAENKRDCDDVGKAYWNLEAAHERADLANNNAVERKKSLAMADAVNKFVADVNPAEVSEQAQVLGQLNNELEKAQINPGFAFMAGETGAGLNRWLLNHCPTELAWGLPSKAYSTALPSCVMLEAQLRRFEINVIRVMGLAVNSSNGAR